MADLILPSFVGPVAAPLPGAAAFNDPSARDVERLARRAVDLVRDAVRRGGDGLPDTIDVSGRDIDGDGRSDRTAWIRGDDALFSPEKAGSSARTARPDGSATCCSTSEPEWPGPFGQAYEKLLAFD